MGSGFSESELGTCTDEERSSRNTQIVAVVPEEKTSEGWEGFK